MNVLCRVNRARAREFQNARPMSAFNLRHCLPYACMNLARLLALLAALPGLSGCTPTKPPNASAGLAAPQRIILDYGNGWYHTSSGNETVRQIGDLYQRSGELVARLNQTSADARPPQGRRLYIPPSNNMERVRQVLIRLQGHPERIPRTPWRPDLIATAQGQRIKLAEPSLKTKNGDVEIVETSWRDRLFGGRKPASASHPEAEGQSAIPQPDAVFGAGGSASREFHWPVSGQVITKFRDGWHDAFHGIEIAAGDGAPVHATRPGKVLMAEAVPGYGNLILIDHGDGFASAYGYNDRMLVKEGDRVGDGQQIASVGRPSRGSASRLFFQIRRNNTPVDPLQFVR